MQIFSYINYFFYLALNWGFDIARHIIFREVKGEKKYGIQTTGADELKTLEKKGIDIDHSNVYMPASYDLLEDVFTKTNVSDFKHLVDIGCGKGRVLCVAAHWGAKKVSGIDFSKEFCAAANQNLLITQHTFRDLNFKIYNNDAFYFEIAEDVDCIFMFNPFDDLIMSGVLENIEISLEEHPRKMTIIYFNPLQKHLLLELGYKIIYQQKKLQYLEAAVFTKSPGESQG